VTQREESAPHLSPSLHLKTEGDRTQTGEGLINKGNETKKERQAKEARGNLKAGASPSAISRKFSAKKTR